MVKADLITGFLGSGKTTFIRKYASYLMSEKQNIGILENDFGAINVDMMILGDLEGELCELEMVAGGCDADCHKRRFKTKLISMGMCGYNRVLIEPSGIYDTDEFFDTLYEEPINRWYETGSVIAVLDGQLEKHLSEEAQYILAAQISAAGIIVFSKIENSTEAEIDHTIDFVNEVLQRQNAKRRITRNDCLIKNWDELDEDDFYRIKTAGSRPKEMRKMHISEDGHFQSLYFMNHTCSKDKISELVQKLFEDQNCGKVFRVKGFAKDENGNWIQLNAQKDRKTLKVSPVGQQVFIVIGETLNEALIRQYVEEI